MALAIEGWANAIEEPIVIFIDVSPRDVGWSDLVERLALHSRIRVLVAIREEDWRLASFVDTDVFREVELDFDKAEANEIYSSLVEFRVSPKFLNFEEAWERFGEAGPLLEFVYLVTQGGLLRQRLASQMKALKRAANRGERSPAELDLLRLVAVASAFTGRLRISSLGDHLQLPAIDEAINLLENEYLVRRSAGRTLIEGLHPIRSEILVELLTDPEIVKWSDVVVRTLRLLDERDLGNFLLHCFSRRRDEVTPILEALVSFQPLTWSGITGGIRALLWLGLREYANANAELINDAKRDSGPGWLVVLDGDISGAMLESTASPFEMIANLATEKRRLQMEALRKRQTPKSHAFVRATSWLEQRTLAPDVPSSTEEWSAAAEGVFWIGRLEADWPIKEWLPTESVTRAMSELPLDIAADLVVGLVEGYGVAFPKWLDTVRPTLRDRFQRELKTPVLDDNEGRLTAHFVVDPGLSLEPDRSVLIPTLDSKNPLHNEALVHVDMMRRLFPDCELYACQGYGHGAGLLHLPNDDTRKTGIPHYRLPLQWQTSINATFGGIVDFDTRPADWAEYANRVLALREDVIRCLADLREVLPIYLRSPRPVAVRFPAEDWYKCWVILRDPPRLPQCAVDEWGFVYEALREDRNERHGVDGRIGLSQIPTVRKYQHLVEHLQTYARALENFIFQASAVRSANTEVRKLSTRGGKATPSDQNWEENSDRRLSTYNLGEAWIALVGLQKQFRQNLGSLVNHRQLATLERRESRIFTEVWPLWFSFALEPDKVLHQPTQITSGLITQTTRRRTNAVKKELRPIVPDARVDLPFGSRLMEVTVLQFTLPQ